MTHKLTTQKFVTPKLFTRAAAGFFVLALAGCAAQQPCPQGHDGPGFGGGTRGFGPPHERLSPEKREALHACIDKTGLKPPKDFNGKWTEPTAKQKAAIDKCFTAEGLKPPHHPSAKERAAFKKCADDAGLPPPPFGGPPKEGDKRPAPPTAEQREKMHACLKEAGIDLPPHGGPHNGPHGGPGGDRGPDERPERGNANEE
ncbi:MAG: hypothetical protein PW788_04975 [Micavibrio sp.]|nr:hypothetical protein [Micavibrio sp.]